MDSLEFHKKYNGKIEVVSRVPVTNREELSLAYTPGVALPCKEIAADVSKVYDYTRKGNLVAVVSVGSAVLGLGNIGPEAGLPVMEGKCILFKEFGGVDAFPIILNTQDVDEIVETVVRISPGFGGINLEDISAPRCFEVERKLSERLDIPVFHDDQHGTAIVVLAGLINAFKVTGKSIETVKIVINGAGAAGIAIAKLLIAAGATSIILVDSTGTIYEGREDLNDEKIEMARITNREMVRGKLAESIQGSDVFIGVSKAGVLSAEMVRTMNTDAIVCALANPIPEIMPDEAKAGGARIIATGRSDFPNQINNVLAFPGIFRGLLDARIRTVTTEMKLAAARAIASCVENPSEENIIPDVFDKRVAERVAEAVKNA
ncbi:MAG: NADP-dependent malic enzyme [Candidatus Magasanikbacteria bacterium]|nr:NADP-dependent malic enzyme [Candidatus Magasanikbacteria bacterium]